MQGTSDDGMIGLYALYLLLVWIPIILFLHFLINFDNNNVSLQKALSSFGLLRFKRILVFFLSTLIVIIPTIFFVIVPVVLLVVLLGLFAHNTPRRQPGDVASPNILLSAC